jgi:hypothetical protein
VVNNSDGEEKHFKNFELSCQWKQFRCREEKDRLNLKISKVKLDLSSHLRAGKNWLLNKGDL